MCGRLNIRGRVYYPGSTFDHQSINGMIRGSWSIGQAYNARIENIDKTWRWIQNNRGVIQVNGFYESGKYIHMINMNLATLYNDDHNFVIITRPSQSSISNIHHRMPLIIENIDDWIRRGITHADKNFHLNIM